MATRRGLAPLDLRASPAAPVPRPPQPTRATWMVESPAAWTAGTAMPASAEATATWVARLPRVRRERVLLFVLAVGSEGVTRGSLDWMESVVVLSAEAQPIARA